MEIRRPDVVRGVARRLVGAGVPTAPRGTPGPSFVSGGRTDADSSSFSVPVPPSSASVVIVAVSSFSR